MKRSLILLAFLLLLPCDIQAYNVHTALTNPKDVLGLLNEENIQLVAVYVKSNLLGPTWEVASLMKVIAYIRKFNAVHAGVGFFRPCNNSELKWVLTIDPKRKEWLQEETSLLMR